MAHVIEPLNEQSCWWWGGSVTNRGYGGLQIRVNGTPIKHYAHREVAHVLRGYNEFDLDDDPLGPILIVERPRMDPDEETIEHLCGNRLCENPDHHIELTRTENSAARWRPRNA
jgi:hypothetical protein